MKLHFLVAASALLASSAQGYMVPAGSLALRGMPAAKSAFVPRRWPATVSRQAAAPHGHAERRSPALATRMEANDGESMPLLTTADQLERVVGMGREAGYGVVVLFKKEVCRKCAALAPRFRTMPQKHSDRKALWVMVNADKLEKERRESMGIKTVPAVLFYDKGGNVLEHYKADGNIATVVAGISEMASKYAEALEEGTTVKSLKDLGFVFDQPTPKQASTGRLIRRDTRAGAMAAGSTTITRP